MESLAELKAMDGKTASENLILCQLDNTLYQNWQVEEIRESLKNKPRILKNFEKSLKPMVKSWIWQFKYDRFGHPTCYRINEQIKEL